MNKEEIAKVKLEIKAELKKEIMEEIAQDSKGLKFDFKAYKKQVVIDDISKAEDMLRTNKWYWHIPLFGLYAFTMMFNRDLANIDRGILRSEFFTQTIHFFIPLIIISAISVLIPTILVVFNHFLLKRAIRKAKIAIEK